MRSNTTICVSFGRDETELLDLLDEGRKKDFLSRSGWFKNKIREEFLNGTQTEKALQTQN